MTETIRLSRGKVAERVTEPKEPDVNLGTLSRFLTIDIGGSGLKAAVVRRSGKTVKPRVRVKTPRPCPPDVLLEHLLSLVEPLAPFDCVAVGFPGVVRAGTIVTAPNLGTSDLQGFALGPALAERLDRPVRVANDAEIHGLAAIDGTGIEMVITLGTGFGTALFDNGRSLPNLELAHHPFHNGKTYEQCLGKQALKKDGRKKWNQLLERAIETLRSLVHFDKLYIGGGHARHVRFELDRDSVIISNNLGVKGGVFLWLGLPTLRLRGNAAAR
jgi:polyphosphate glucokinase